jgi:threonine/homoserine/homoserine lactone efflux protein
MSDEGLTSQELAALLAFTTAMAFTPGPNTTLSTALAANHGLKVALRFVLAVPLGWGLLFTICSFGVGAVVTAQPALRGALMLTGVAYMLWLAWRLARTGRPGEAGAQTLRVGLAQGVALQFVNIKAWMNALAISATWVAVHGQVTQRFVQVLPIMLAYGFASNFTYALVGSLLRRWLAQGHRLLWFNRAMAAVLVATAAWLLRL